MILREGAASSDRYRTAPRGSQVSGAYRSKPLLARIQRRETIFPVLLQAYRGYSHGWDGISRRRICEDWMHELMPGLYLREVDEGELG
jgi:hypothetical protein